MQVQLVFRTEEGEFFELRDSPADFEGHGLGESVREGNVLLLHGSDWVVTEVQHGEIERVVLVPSAGTSAP